jgi:pimeloyl-ACP methyl ester carboxylesterase
MEQYSRMGDYLVQDLGYERGKDLLEFPYDWRRDVRDSARKLAQAIDEWLPAEPVTIIAHSLGTLVSRYYIQHLGGERKVRRAILMGGPHTGVPKGATSLIVGPKILPFGLMGERLRRVVASFVSSYQILPEYACTFDQAGRPFELLEDDSWVSNEQKPLLRTGREFRRELGHSTKVPVVSIFGYGLKTITRLNIVRGADGSWASFSFDSTEEGDSTVPQASAILPNTEIHPVRQFHGILFVDNDVRMRLKLLLTE